MHAKTIVIMIVLLNQAADTVQDTMKETRN